MTFPPPTRLLGIYAATLLRNLVERYGCSLRIPSSETIKMILRRVMPNGRESWGRIMDGSGSSSKQFLSKKVSINNSDASVQEVVRAAQEELQGLIRQRAEVMKRIGTVKQTIVGLANLFGDSILSEELQRMLDRKSSRQLGFTKACRIVLMEASRPLGAREVCEQIQVRIPPIMERHKDPLASVTTVLNRLVEYGEAKAVVRENGRRAWEWVSDAPSARLVNAAITDGSYSELSS